MESRSIYTLGTGLRSAEDFIEILLSYDIRAVIDVRSFPRSKLPHFSQIPLSDLLESINVTYHFLGKELGGYKKGGFTAYVTTEEFSQGVGMVEAIAEKGGLCYYLLRKIPLEMPPEVDSQGTPAQGMGR